MLPANAYVIRQATVDDEGVLRRLAKLDSRPPLVGPALIGEIDGTPAAAVSPANGSIAGGSGSRSRVSRACGAL